MAFLGHDDFFVIEKASGQVKRVHGRRGRQRPCSTWRSTRASERGLLGIALHPEFRHQPATSTCSGRRALTGADSTRLADVPLLGNRVDRYVWNGTTLTFDRTIIRLRAFQADAGQPLRGNHNGGVIRFGPDGKLYIIIGDTGRRGRLQNLLDGPFGAGIAGRPVRRPGARQRAPHRRDPAAERRRHRARATTRSSATGAARGGQVGANLRSSTPTACATRSGWRSTRTPGDLWEQENGDDSFSEINRVEPGFNSGWVQIMGPSTAWRSSSAIETDRASTRTRTATSACSRSAGPRRTSRRRRTRRSRGCSFCRARASATRRCVEVRVAPGGIAFLHGDGLGRRYDGDLFVGSATRGARGGYLFRLPIERAGGGSTSPTAAARPGGGQHRQVRRHRERDAAVRRTSAYARRPVEPWTRRSTSSRSRATRSTRCAAASPRTALAAAACATARRARRTCG